MIQLNNKQSLSLAATQIFVDPDGEVKFEMSEMDQDIVEEVATTGGLEIDEDVEPSSSSDNSPQSSHKQFHPVKKRSSTVVSKCNRCNGTGMVYVEASGSTTSCAATGGHSNSSPATTSAATLKKEKMDSAPSNPITVDLDTMHPPPESGNK